MQTVKINPTQCADDQIGKLNDAPHPSGRQPERRSTTDPTTEGVAIDGVGLGGAGVAVSFDVVQESAEILLPPVDVRVP